jgi:hypothetical protein
MEAAAEIRSALKNIRYYAEQIEALARRQFDRDMEIGLATGMNPEPGSVRFDCLGCIGAATKWIDTYCDNIESNVKHAESQDSKLRPLPEEQAPKYEEAVTPEEYR